MAITAEPESGDRARSVTMPRGGAERVAVDSVPPVSAAGEAAPCPCCGGRALDASHIGRVRFQEFHYRYLRCRMCGSLRADPMPGPALLAEIYAPSYVETHYSAELADESSSGDLERESTAALALALGHCPGGRLLDVGCGAGRFVRAAAQAGFHAEGHEITAGAAAVAAEKSGRPVHTGPLASLPRRYDVIHLADVLEHSPTPGTLLREAVTLIGDGGVLLLRGPLENQRNLFQAVTVARRRLRTRLFGEPLTEMPPYHVNLFTLAGWHSLIGGAGLRPLGEQVSEVHWPAPERFAPSAAWAVKALSLLVTRSPVGARLHLGNRVMGLYSPA